MKIGNKYKSYEEYLEHQAKKAELPEVKIPLEQKRVERVEWFASQFKGKTFGKRVLCLGARYGEEVEALRNLGIPAIGIDIKACLPYVVSGDMNDLSGYSEVQTIYTNALDHCWSAMDFLRGIHKALKHNGHLILHVSYGVGEYETCSPESNDEYRDLFNRAGFNVIDEGDTDPVRYQLKYCFVLRKGKAS